MKRFLTSSIFFFWVVFSLLAQDSKNIDFKNLFQVWTPAPNAMDNKKTINLNVFTEFAETGHMYLLSSSGERTYTSKFKLDKKNRILTRTTGSTLQILKLTTNQLVLKSKSEGEIFLVKKSDTNTKFKWKKFRKEILANSWEGKVSTVEGIRFLELVASDSLNWDLELRSFKMINGQKQVEGFDKINLVRFGNTFSFDLLPYSYFSRIIALTGDAIFLIDLGNELLILKKRIEK